MTVRRHPEDSYMLGHDLKNFDSLKQWLNKLFPIGTQVFDQIGIDYVVTGWYAAHDRVHIQLTHGSGMEQLTRDVPFDQLNLLDEISSRTSE